MAQRRPLVFVSGVTSELPIGDTVVGADVTIVAGSGLGSSVAGSTTTLNVSLAPNASGLIFVGDTLGSDGAAQITANTALASGNAAQVTANTALASGNAALAAAAAGGTYRVSTSGFTLQKNEFVVVSSGSLIFTLPATPTQGDEVGFIVAGNYRDTVVSGNGAKIMGLAENLTINCANATVGLVYIDTNNGWRFN